MAGWQDIDWGFIGSGMPTPGFAPQTPAPSFDDRYGAAFPRSPISPENLAGNLAARGVPPPPVDIPPQSTNVGAALTGQEPYRLAGPEAMDNWRTSVDVSNAGGPGAVGAPRAPATPAGPAPMNIQSPIQEQQVAGANAPTDVSANKKEGDTLLDALKGVKAPAAPELQRLGTPAAPRPTGTVKSGQLLALLQALNVGQGAGDRNLPSTLGSALRRG